MTVAQERASVNRLHYGWIVAGVTFLALLAAAGVRSSTSVFIVPIETEFGWTRTTLSAAIAINLLLYGLLGPFAAAFMDRIGLRATTIIAFAIMAVGMLGTLAMTAAWQLMLLWGVVIGTGTGMASLVMGAVVPIAGSSRGAAWSQGCSPRASPRDSSFSSRCSRAS